MNIKAAIDKCDQLKAIFREDTHWVFQSMKEVLRSLQEPEDDKTMDMFVAVWKRLDRLEDKWKKSIQEPSSVSECEEFKCQHCGKREGTWFDRTISDEDMNMATRCNACGKDIDEPKSVSECKHIHTVFATDELGRWCEDCKCLIDTICHKCGGKALRDLNGELCFECKNEPTSQGLSETAVKYGAGHSGLCQAGCKCDAAIAVYGDKGKPSPSQDKTETITISRKVAEEWQHRHQFADLNSESYALIKEFNRALSTNNSKR